MKTLRDYYNEEIRAAKEAAKSSGEKVDLDEVDRRAQQRWRDGIEQMYRDVAATKEEAPQQEEKLTPEEPPSESLYIRSDA